MSDSEQNCFNLIPSAGCAYELTLLVSVEVTGVNDQPLPSAAYNP